MSADIVKVSPASIRWRLSIDMECESLDHERWSRGERHLLAESAKHQSLVQRYVEGRPWEDTPLFRDIYTRRLAYESVRGCRTIEALLAQYYGRVDAMFADMQANGFRQIVDGRRVPPIKVYVSHDNELLMGNQGNHRLAMAQILNLDHVVCEIVGRHPDSQRTDEAVLMPVGPDLPDRARSIPAMTTEAERLCYYRLAMEQASQGAIVELGTWLGAATAYLAAGVRDAGVSTKVQSYDRFVWKPSSHNAKAGGPISTTQLAACQANLGPLLEHVELHAGEVTKLQWRGGYVSLLVCDAPKRTPEISSVLQAFAKALQPGSIMAWQDFAYFPSYDIPAAMIRLGDRVEFVEAVYPGTTAVFRVRSMWNTRDVSPQALAIQSWTPDEVESAWDRWSARLPEPMRPRFDCGAAMFLCDLGATDRAQKRLRSLIANHADAILPKWRYLVEQRASLMRRYQPLVELLPCA